MIHGWDSFCPLNMRKNAKTNLFRQDLHRVARVSRFTLHASRFTLHSPRLLIPSVSPFVYLAFLAGHQMHVFAKRTQMKTETRMSLRRRRMRLECARFSQTQSNPVKVNSECGVRNGAAAHPTGFESDPAQSDSIRLLLSHSGWRIQPLHCSSPPFGSLSRFFCYLEQ